MKANAIMSHGNAQEVFKIIDIPTPQIGEYDILIKVEATSVNPLDCKIRIQSNVPRSFPLILGFDVCGIIVEKGTKVNQFNIGERVIASPHVYRSGANAEYVAVDARTCALANGLNSETMAAIPLAGITAYESIYERLKIKSGDTILIHAGAGGVGHFAIQLANAIGANVITTAGREESIFYCENDLKVKCINYRTNLEETIKEFTEGRMLDYILDTVGGNTFENSLNCLRPNGQICTILPVGIPDSMGYKNLLKNITVSYEFMGTPTVYDMNKEKQGRILTDLIDMYKKGIITPKVSSVFNFEELPLAHEQIEGGHTIGKVVVKV